MKRMTYPFTAIVGQADMKLALLLAAVDWRLGVLLRGDKGSGKTTAARGLSALLPAPAPFINLPIGVTEDRLLGGLHVERAIKGDPVLKPGLLSEAHGGVLYIDEVNLLPAHLGDALLDAAASGINVVEREGLSASHPAEFMLLGSMNPEEGSLRPQLLDRFALSVTVAALLDPTQRRAVIERRIAFERDPGHFFIQWAMEEATIRANIISARARLTSISCPPEMLEYISSLICEAGIHSLRADLAVMRAAIAHASLEGDDAVEACHVEVVLPFVLAHRTRSSQRPSPSPPAPQKTESKKENFSDCGTQNQTTRVFPPRVVETPALKFAGAADSEVGIISIAESRRGAIIGSRQSDQPKELDLRATMTQALRETGTIVPQATDLHERLRESNSGTRYLFVIDSSGSHAVRERMRLVKGATISLLNRSFKRGDEVAIVVFRGTSAEVLLEPTPVLADAFTALEYLPTGGRTPLAHGLALSKSYITPKTILILLTDGRANYSINKEDPWQEAVDAARGIRCPFLVVDTETKPDSLSQAKELAVAVNARCLTLEELSGLGDVAFEFSAS
jgi:magnesium chelatase subunit D